MARKGVGSYKRLGCALENDPGVFVELLRIRRDASGWSEFIYSECVARPLHAPTVKSGEPAGQGDGRARIASDRSPQRLVVKV